MRNIAVSILFVAGLMLAPGIQADDAGKPTGLWKKWSKLALKPDQLAYIFEIRASFQTPMVWLVVCDARQTAISVERRTFSTKAPVDFQHTWVIDGNGSQWAFENNRIAELAKHPTSDQSSRLDGTTYTIRIRVGKEPDKEYLGYLNCDPNQPSEKDCQDSQEATFAWLLKVTGIMPRSFLSHDEAGWDEGKANKPRK